MNAPTNTPPDPPEIAAAIARRKQTLDRQAVMATAGMAAVAGFLVFYPSDHARTIAGLLDILPWFLGLSILIVAANRWTLAQYARSIRRSSQAPADPPKA
jgi:hypothetical protein